MYPKWDVIRRLGETFDLDLIWTANLVSKNKWSNISWLYATCRCETECLDMQNKIPGFPGFRKEHSILEKCPTGTQTGVLATVSHTLTIMPRGPKILTRSLGVVRLLHYSFLQKAHPFASLKVPGAGNHWDMLLTAEPGWQFFILFVLFRMILSKGSD